MNNTMSHDSNDILFKLGELSGKLDAVILAQTTQLEEMRALTARVTALENTRSYLLGAAAVLGVLSSSLTSLLIR